MGQGGQRKGQPRYWEGETLLGASLFPGKASGAAVGGMSEARNLHPAPARRINAASAMEGCGQSPSPIGTSLAWPQLAQQPVRKEWGGTQPSGVGAGTSGAMAVGREPQVPVSHVMPGWDLLRAGGWPSLEK